MLLPGEGVVTLSLVGLSVEFSASPVVKQGHYEKARNAFRMVGVGSFNP